jgi:hypothetical protein
MNHESKAGQERLENAETKQQTARRVKNRRTRPLAFYRRGKAASRLQRTGTPRGKPKAGDLAKRARQMLGCERSKRVVAARIERLANTSASASDLEETESPN